MGESIVNWRTGESIPHGRTVESILHGRMGESTSLANGAHGVVVDPFFDCAMIP